MANKKKRKNASVKEIQEIEVLTEDTDNLIVDVKAEEETEDFGKGTEELIETKEVREKVIKKNTKPKFRVCLIISDRAVMTKSLDTDRWHTKPNNNYKIGDIIE